MIIKNAEYIKTALKLEDLPLGNIPEIALAGRSNVGKSSFINSISHNSHLARVSKVPGKTITLNYYLINKEFYFVDMPGYGYAKRNSASLETFSLATDKYLKSRENLKGVVLIVDSRVITDDDKMMMDYLKQNGIKYLVIMNKIDKLKRNDILKQKKLAAQSLNINEDEIKIYSSLTKEKEEELLLSLEKLIFS